MTEVSSLSAEWERIELLAACVAASRRGAEVPTEIKQRLRGVQDRVQVLRQQAPWQKLVDGHSLLPMDQDILACALAPEAAPRLGWMFQELQPGLVSAHPTLALIQELFFMNQDDARVLLTRFTQSAPLLRSGLIERRGQDLFQPVRATPRARVDLLDWPVVAHQGPPGALEIPAVHSWDDLVLPASCHQALREYLFWVTHRHQVVEKWGARVSGGPVALFSGPSGTGKTFAASVLANALQWPIYRVDLGMLVSKYIGETEKNLNSLFDAAHGQAMVLLFDEADSLFGKRGEIKEARDRYANMEVSHLLSRMERHQGPCILTTNLRRHLDPAFARRFQVVVEFPRPDVAARVELWRKHLPPHAPCSPEVDPTLLGEELNLNGGQIRNVALHAAFLAAGESGVISLAHIARAVWTELAKEGREMMASSLGALAEYLPNGDAQC